MNLRACMYLLSFENQKPIDTSVWMYTYGCSLVCQLLFILDLFYTAVVQFSAALWGFFIQLGVFHLKPCQQLTVAKGLYDNRAWASGHNLF